MLDFKIIKNANSDDVVDMKKQAAYYDATHSILCRINRIADYCQTGKMILLTFHTKKLRLRSEQL